MDNDFYAYGSDIDDSIIEIAKLNASRAGVKDKINFFTQDIKTSNI
jgi:23S rRNA G2445 N2-methylase RlmL